MSTWIHRLKKKRNNWALWVNSLINNDDGDDYYRNNHDNNINRIITADCKKCHRSCVFAAACTVSLSSFLGFPLREVISVRLGILSQKLEPHMGVPMCRNTPTAMHCLWDTSQGITPGCANEETPCLPSPHHYGPTPPQFHLTPPFISNKGGRKRREVTS